MNEDVTFLNITAAALLIFVVCAAAQCQKPVEQPEYSQVEQELTKLEKEWSDAFLKHDTSTIDRILADDYVGTDGRGIVTSKADEIDEAKSPGPGESVPFTILDETVTDMKVRAYGNVAIVNGRVIEKVRNGTQEGKIQYRRTTVWVKRKDGWQCVSFHGSRILEPPQTR